MPFFQSFESRLFLIYLCSLKLSHVQHWQGILRKIQYGICDPEDSLLMRSCPFAKLPFSYFFCSQDTTFLPKSHSSRNFKLVASKLAKSLVPKPQIGLKFSSHGYILLQNSVHMGPISAVVRGPSGRTPIPMPKLKLSRAPSRLNIAMGTSVDWICYEFTTKLLTLNMSTSMGTFSLETWYSNWYFNFLVPYPHPNLSYVYSLPLIFSNILTSTFTKISHSWIVICTFDFINFALVIVVNCKQLPN